jgi:hypothetical protein
MKKNRNIPKLVANIISFFIVLGALFFIMRYNQENSLSDCRTNLTSTETRMHRQAEWCDSEINGITDNLKMCLNDLRSAYRDIDELKQTGGN